MCIVFFVHLNKWMRCIRSNFLSWCKYTFSCDPKCVLKAKGNKVSKVQKVHVQVYYIQVDFNSLSKFSSRLILETSFKYFRVQN